MRLQSADSLTNTSVTNPQGENLGQIKAIMLDVETGRIAYAVLDFGGFLGIGSKHFALPWRGFTFNMARGEIILDISKEKLENAEGFDSDQWPDLADPEFANRTYDYYGHERYWETTKP